MCGAGLSCCVQQPTFAGLGGSDGGAIPAIDAGAYDFDAAFLFDAAGFDAAAYLPTYTCESSCPTGASSFACSGSADCGGNACCGVSAALFGAVTATCSTTTACDGVTAPDGGVVGQVCATDSDCPSSDTCYAFGGPGFCGPAYDAAAFPPYDGNFPPYDGGFPGTDGGVPPASDGGASDSGGD